MPCFLLQIYLLVNAAYLAASQRCSTVGSEKCGCSSFSRLAKTSNYWARYIFSHATQEDAEYYYIDDMAFGKSQIASDGGSTQQADKIPYVYWPGGVIHYYIDSAFTPAYREIILSAMDTLQGSVGKAHLEFVEASTVNGKVCQRNYVKIEMTTKPSQCQAEIGMQRSKPTFMWLNEKSCPNGTIVHELLHVLGRFHEHSRPDRDTYVTIRSREIGATFCGNFMVMPHDWASVDPTLMLPYDIESIMHYGPCSFSCQGGYTLLRKSGTPVPTANRQRLTELDKAKLKAMFPSNTKRTPDDVDRCIREHDRNVAFRLLPQLRVSTIAILSWSVALMPMMRIFL